MTEPRYRHVPVPLDGSEFGGRRGADRSGGRPFRRRPAAVSAESPGDVGKLRSHAAGPLGFPAGDTGAAVVVRVEPT